MLDGPESPPWGEIPALMDELVESWLRSYEALIDADVSNRIEALASFMRRLLVIRRSSTETAASRAN